MRSFHRAAGLHLVPLMIFGAMVCAVEFRVWCEGQASDPKAVWTNRREQELELTEVKAKIAVNHWLLGELIEGRLSLPEVTDEFVRLNWARPEMVSKSRLTYPGSDEGESKARQVIACQVIACAEDKLKERHDLTPEQHRRVLRRLEAELREMCK